MKKMAFLIAFMCVFIGFQAKTAHAQGGMPCGSYGLSPSDPCVPNGEEMCQEWVYDSSGNVVPGTEQCTPSVPVGGVKRWTSDIGQECSQPVAPDGSPTQAAECLWPAVQKSLGNGCSEMVYSAGPQAGEALPGPAFCPDMSSDGESLKTWTEP